MLKLRIPEFMEAVMLIGGLCYGGAKRTDMDPTVFPSFGVSMTEREIQSVTDYVIAVLRGKGELTREECMAFGGADSERVRKPYP